MRLNFLPSRVSVWTLAGLSVACAVALVAGAPLRATAQAAAGLALCLLLFALADLAWSQAAWRRAPLRWQRRLPAAFAIGVPRSLGGTLINEGDQAWRVALFDRVDPSIDFDGLPRALRVPPRARLELQYELTPRRRGPVTFEPADLRVRTRLGSAEMLLRVGEAQSLRVYPNFAAVARYAWLAGDHRLAEIGIKIAPQRGAGTDFKQLAEYKAGDSIRHIDWKATLRHRRAIVREYQDERDQTVLFLLDCGRRMRADEAGATRGAGSHFDEALNALMLLAHVALKEGDAVGAITFGTDPADARSFAPRKGSASLNALIAALYDIEPRATHSDYLEAAAHLMRVAPKRALVVVLTNFRDEDSAEIEPALRLMRSRHLVLLASLRERVLRELAEQPQGDATRNVNHATQAIEIAGAHLFAQSRDDAFKRLATRDGLLIDVEPEQLPGQLVSRYRAIKRAGML
jgi:uncharacterized protein (DUF58 family)